MDNEILTRSEDFAVAIIRLYQRLANKNKEYVLSKQILRSGTSIGANVTEAQNAQSRPIFFKNEHCIKGSDGNKILA